MTKTLNLAPDAQFKQRRLNMQTNNELISEYFWNGYMIRSAVNGKLGVILQPIDGGFLMFSNRLHRQYIQSFNDVDDLFIEPDGNNAIVLYEGVE